MTNKRLSPHLKNLKDESVLVQAWKKSASYIRGRSWTVDTLALDHASINLPNFIKKIRNRLDSGDRWKNKPLRLVLSPKSQKWTLDKDIWVPQVCDCKSYVRPLACVDLADQVVATAIMLCLADRVETLQGSPVYPADVSDNRKKVSSYGNRLFCSETSKRSLWHRWGSTKLYRAYYQDYRSFLSRPDRVINKIKSRNTENLILVAADLKQFYDRVHPELLSNALNLIREPKKDDDEFYNFAKSALCWNWDEKDLEDIEEYEQKSEIKNFRDVALPQGLVASGFFANIVLYKFDEALRNSFDTEIDAEYKLRLLDASRYVDDIQLLLERPEGMKKCQKQVKQIVSQWLQNLLDQHAFEIPLSECKTEVNFLDDEKQPLVGQKAKMNRIQTAVSGGFDFQTGVEVMDATMGLMRTQLMLQDSDKKQSWRFSPIPDVREATVARFSASKFLRTYRYIRPLSRQPLDIEKKEITFDEDFSAFPPNLEPTRSELDDDAKVCALVLIEKWLNDPSNVRVLLVGLDLWPDFEVLNDLFTKFRNIIETAENECNKLAKQVVWYCLGEILRAGATQTGFVDDEAQLSDRLNLPSYRHELCEMAKHVLSLPRTSIPWYLRQQALLALASVNPLCYDPSDEDKEEENHLYYKLIRFLRGDKKSFNLEDYATFAILTRRSFLNRSATEKLVLPNLNKDLLVLIAKKDPSFCYELIQSTRNPKHLQELPEYLKADLCLNPMRDFQTSLASVILNENGTPKSPLRDELSVLFFAKRFLEKLNSLENQPEVITPGQVLICLDENYQFESVKRVLPPVDRPQDTVSFYSTPTWCEPKERWRLQLGFLIRFILAGRRDYTRPVRRDSWKEQQNCYRIPESHWYQRIHGMYSTQPSFGDDWLPISEWLEGLLLALLQWPGCRVPKEFNWVAKGMKRTIGKIKERISSLKKKYGTASNLLILPLKIKQSKSTALPVKSLKACVVQPSIPKTRHFENLSDLTLDDKEMRRKHRNHLSSLLKAIDNLHSLQENDRGDRRNLDLLILPELTVHPKDVYSHLVPFARANKTIILSGLTYEKVLPGQPLVNSALWIIPEDSKDNGLQIRIRRQGKQHLAHNEIEGDGIGNQRRQGFRPCQWLIGYPYSSQCKTDLLWLSAAICYDATDLALATDLRDQSDVLIVPALNKDVNTFDKMALALHYHMFQLVIVANNGEYGGSNAYWPKKESYERQIFHFHGQSQANIFFFDIDDIEGFKKRLGVSKHTSTIGVQPEKSSVWKTPPAGLNP